MAKLVWQGAFGDIAWKRGSLTWCLFRYWYPKRLFQKGPELWAGIAMKFMFPCLSLFADVLRQPLPAQVSAPESVYLSNPTLGHKKGSLLYEERAPKRSSFYQLNLRSFLQGAPSAEWEQLTTEVRDGLRS